MKNHKSLACFALLLAITLLFSSCGSNASDTSKQSSQETAGSTPQDVHSYSTFSLLFHEPYLDAAGIDVHCQSERKNLMKKIPEVLETEPIHVTEETSFFRRHYAVTVSENSKYLYYGETEDNRPDGFGILTTGMVDLNDIRTYSCLVYAGDFSEGQYDGYGACFARDSYDLTVAEYSNSELPEDILPAICVYASFYVTKDGEWRKGQMSGDANIFEHMGSFHVPQSNYWGISCYPDVKVAQMKKDEVSGKSKVYVDGILKYDGEMKKGEYDGYGTAYFDDGSILYEGEWKKDVYHGKGTLYNADGTVSYTGKWKNGDYAS